MADNRRLHVFFSGHVHGVGFRYTAKLAAERLGITGWVRNLSDGRVELAGEHTAEVLERFLSDLQSEMSGHVTKVERTWETATGEWTGFEIKRSA